MGASNVLALLAGEFGGDMTERAEVDRVKKGQKVRLLSGLGSSPPPSQLQAAFIWQTWSSHVFAIMLLRADVALQQGRGALEPCRGWARTSLCSCPQATPPPPPPPLSPPPPAATHLPFRHSPASSSDR